MREKTKEAMLTVEGYSEQICTCLTLTISLGYRWRRESIRGKVLISLELNWRYLDHQILSEGGRIFRKEDKTQTNSKTLSQHQR